MSERLTAEQESDIRWRLEGAWSLVWSEIDALRADLRHALECDGRDWVVMRAGACPECAAIRKRLEER